MALFRTSLILAISVFLWPSRVVLGAQPAVPEHSSTQRDIYVLELSQSRQLPPIFDGQINNQILAIFASLPGFHSQLLSSIKANDAAVAMLAARLKAIARNTKNTPQPMNVGGTTLSPGLQQRMAHAFCILLPLLTDYSEQTIPGHSDQKKARGAGRVRVEVEIRFSLLNPLSGKTTPLFTVKARGNHENRYGAWSACVTTLGRRMAWELESSTLFDTDTEISTVRGDTVFFRNNDPIEPFIGLEYSIIRLTRFPDGYVDERFLGHIRVHGKSGPFWKGKVIFGVLPYPGDRLRVRNRIRVTLDADARIYLIDWPASRFSGFTNSSPTFQSEHQLYGVGLKLTGETGFSTRLYLDGSYLMGKETAVWQGTLGFGWDVYLARTLIWQVSLTGAVRYVIENLGLVNDGSVHEGKRLSARALSPGLEIRSAMYLMLSGSFSLQLNMGYAYFFPVPGDNWDFYVGNEIMSQYRPQQINPVPGFGPLAGFALSLRL